MTLQQSDLDYFDRGNVENPRFWARFGGKPNLQNALIADVGCGHGSLCIDMAMSGARRVIGFELNGRKIEFAKENLHRNYPDLEQIVEFRYQDMAVAPETDFDFIVTKDTFEHVLYLARLLEALKQKLAAGGKIFAGFSPLWNSPFGDHRRTRIGIPWGHVIFTEKFLIRRLARKYPEHESVKSIYELGLNKLSLADYRRIFQESGLSIDFFRVNNSDRFVSKVFSLLRKMPLLEEYFSFNIYAILGKP